MSLSLAETKAGLIEWNGAKDPPKDLDADDLVVYASGPAGLGAARVGELFWPSVRAYRPVTAHPSGAGS